MSSAGSHGRKVGKVGKVGKSGKGGMWGWPIALGVASGAGLVVGLFSDGGVGDLVGNVLLALPVAACAWWGWLKR